MVTKGHIDRLVALAAYGPGDNDTLRGYRPDTRWYAPGWWRGEDFHRLEPCHLDELETLGALLIAENLRSIHARYPDTPDSHDDVPGPTNVYWGRPYSFPLHTERVTVAEGLRAISCYEYQACESDDWRQTEAHSFCQGLREALCGVIEDTAKRGWDNWDRATAEREVRL